MTSLPGLDPSDASALDALGFGIYRTDTEGRCTQVNPAALAMLGFGADELLGQDLHGLIHHSAPDGAPLSRAAGPVATAGRTGRPVRLSNEAVWRRDGGLILAGAMFLVAAHLVPVAVAFAGAAALMLVLRIMTMDEAYESVEWSVIVLLAALIPVSGAIQATGGTDLIAAGLERVAGALPPILALGLMIVLAMAITPFLNNAATVLVMAPIAASLAGRLGLNPDPFLMAVAVGSACDFLTPIGHQCNTLVMGPGGYRFGDYWKLGLPLSFLVVIVGTPLIAAVWGLGLPG